MAVDMPYEALLLDCFKNETYQQVKCLSTTSNERNGGFVSRR